MLPSLQLLEKVSKKIVSVPNRKKESKRGIHFGCFLLGYKSGLRISEAVSFDLGNKTRKGLYRISKCKGKKERLVYVSPSVIGELKKQDWKPNQTNRHNFYHFLKKVKRELNISKSIELSPHTLRRAFTTYHAESGMPLPLLSKLLGHSSIRTTALYWQNIYGDDNPDDILIGKKWLENKPSESTSTENFPETPKHPEPIFIDQKPVIPNKNPIQQDNSLSASKSFKKTPKLINKISPSSQEKFSLKNTNKKSDQLKTSQPLALIADKEQKSTERELILLQKIKQLEKQLAQVQAENNDLKIENQHLKALVQQDQDKTEAKIIQPLPWKPGK